MYEKKRITEGGDDAEVECGFCTRAKCGIICRQCSAVFPNIRARKSCPDHPREMFLMDLLTCPACKSRNIDDISSVDVDSVDQAGPSRPSGPVQVVMPMPTRKRAASSTHQESSTMLSPPVTPVTPVSIQGVAMDSRMTMTPIRNVVRPASAWTSSSVVPITRVAVTPPSAGFSMEIGTPARATIAENDPMSPTNVCSTSVGISNEILTSGQNLILLTPNSAMGHPSPPGCICQRRINYVICNDCGYFQAGAVGSKRVKACPVHPTAYELVERCPLCNRVNSLEEDLIAESNGI